MRACLTLFVQKESPINNFLENKTIKAILLKRSCSGKGKHLLFAF